MADATPPFNTNILKVFGLDTAPEAEQEAFLQRAGEAVLGAVVRRISQHLPEDKREEFFRLFEQPSSDEEKNIFFEKYVSNFQGLLLEEVARFKREALAAAQSSADAA